MTLPIARRAGDRLERTLMIKNRKTGFTLVELLVVIGIIGLLVSILLPVLGRARDVATRLKCLSNMKQLGTAMLMYVGENSGSYPYHEYWYNLSGKKGDLAKYSIAMFPPIDQTGLRDDAGSLVERPLNQYLNQMAEVSRCPGDIGDAKKPTVTDCFDAYGTSYFTQWRDGSTTAAFGVIPVTGGASVNPAGGRIIDPTRKAARYGAAIQFNGRSYGGDWTRKIILGDFNWQGNRPITDGRVLFHRPENRNVRQQNMLFGDGHAEFFTFPPNYGAFDLPVSIAVNGFW